MNASTMPVWLIAILFAVGAILLLSGRGSFLIAGYNTAPKETKANFKEKWLCRVTGGGLAVIAGITASSTYYNFNMPAAFGWLMPWGLLATVAAELILANTVCKVK